MNRQQDAVLIALTRDGMPRTARNMAAETSIRQASIRRTISELRMAGYKIRFDGPLRVYVYEGKPSPTSIKRCFGN